MSIVCNIEKENTLKISMLNLKFLMEIISVYNLLVVLFVIQLDLYFFI